MQEERKKLSYREVLGSIGIGKLGLMLVAGIALVALSMPKKGGTTSRVTPTLALWQGLATETETKEQEQHFSEMLAAMAGVGTCEVMLAEDETGLLVVSKAADDPELVLQIVRAAEVIFSIPAHKVYVVPYNVSR